MGRIAGSYGVRGWVKVAPGGGAAQGLADAKEWWIGDKPYKVVAKPLEGRIHFGKDEDEATPAVQEGRPAAPSSAAAREGH